MNLLTRLSLSFIASTHRTFRRIIIRGVATAAGNLESEKGDCVTSYYTLITDELSRAVELLDQMRGLSPSKTNYTSLINSLCKQDDRIDEAYRVFIQMILSGFSPSVHTSNEVVSGFLRIGGEINHNTTLITEMCKAKELSHAVQLLDHMRRVKKALTPNKTTFTSLIHFLCKQDRFDEAYSVLNEMFLSGFSPSFPTLDDVFLGFLRIGETGKAYEMFKKMEEHKLKQPSYGWSTFGHKYSWLIQGFSDGVAYTSLMNAYLDQGQLHNVDKLLYHIRQFNLYCRTSGSLRCRPDSVINSAFINGLLPDSVINSVFINGLDNKARTTNTMWYLLRFNYDKALWLVMPTLEYRRTLAVNCSDDEFKSLVKLVEGFCNMGLENAYDTMLKWNYKPNGIVYNLCIIEHCKRDNTNQAYNMYKEMVHNGFACHMFAVFALIQTLGREAMFNELRWVVQNVLRSCNLNDSEILKFLNEFNPNKPGSEALLNVLAEKAKDGPFLKCS